MSQGCLVYFFDNLLSGNVIGCRFLLLITEPFLVDVYLIRCRFGISHHHVVLKYVSRISFPYLSCDLWLIVPDDADGYLHHKLSAKYFLSSSVPLIAPFVSVRLLSRLFASV
jgi:hypothetical protein